MEVAQAQDRAPAAPSERARPLVAPNPLALRTGAHNHAADQGLSSRTPISVNISPTPGSGGTTASPGTVLPQELSAPRLWTPKGSGQRPIMLSVTDSQLPASHGPQAQQLSSLHRDDALSNLLKSPLGSGLSEFGGPQFSWASPPPVSDKVFFSQRSGLTPFSPPGFLVSHPKLHGGATHSEFAAAGVDTHILASPTSVMTERWRRASSAAPKLMGGGIDQLQTPEPSARASARRPMDFQQRGLPPAMAFASAPLSSVSTSSPGLMLKDSPFASAGGAAAPQGSSAGGGAGPGAASTNPAWPKFSLSTTPLSSAALGGSQSHQFQLRDLLGSPLRPGGGSGFAHMFTSPPPSIASTSLPLRNQTSSSTSSSSTMFSEGSSDAVGALLRTRQDLSRTPGQSQQFEPLPLAKPVVFKTCVQATILDQFRPEEKLPDHIYERFVVLRKNSPNSGWIVCPRDTNPLSQSSV